MPSEHQAVVSVELEKEGGLSVYINTYLWREKLVIMNIYIRDYSYHLKYGGGKNKVNFSCGLDMISPAVILLSANQHSKTP